MRYAIFSDIHNHKQALTAVLNHAGRQQVDNYFCLGDMGDIGVDDCVSVVREMGIPAVFGNWEMLTWHHYSPENQRWVLNLPPIHKESHFWLTHAAPLWHKKVMTLADLKEERLRMPVSNFFPYLHFESAALWKTLTTLLDAHIPLMFHGHTHYQMTWRFTHNNHLQKLMERTVILSPGDTLIVGVGSVGRSEDNPKPSYIIYDDEARVIEMMRV
jgi:predicted phosphodiesterase